MATPKLELKYKFMTATETRVILGLSRYQMDERIRRGILPSPTLIDDSGVRFFDQKWVDQAQDILSKRFARAI
jgi:hypothetical protein